MTQAGASGGLDTEVTLQKFLEGFFPLLVPQTPSEEK